MQLVSRGQILTKEYIRGVITTEEHPARVAALRSGRTALSHTNLVYPDFGHRTRGISTVFFFFL